MYLVEETARVELERLKTQREGYFWPSECSILYRPIPSLPEVVQTIGTCRRRVYWRWMREPHTNPIQPKSIRRMQIGKAIERQEIDWYFAAGFGIARNFKFQNPLRRISGEGDALVFDPENGIIGVEIKSFNGVGSGYYAGKEIFGNKSQTGFPRIDNLLQTMLYLDSTKIKLWRIEYLERSELRTTEFEIMLDTGKCAIVTNKEQGLHTRFSGFGLVDVYTRMDDLYSMIAKRILPPRDFRMSYPADEVEARFVNGLISKTKYEAWRKDPRTNTVGDWQCSPAYCVQFKRCQDAQKTAAA
jgi:hypothetical protein